MALEGFNIKSDNKSPGVKPSALSGFTIASKPITPKIATPVATPVASITPAPKEKSLLQKIFTQKVDKELGDIGAFKPKSLLFSKSKPKSTGPVLEARIGENLDKLPVPKLQIGKEQYTYTPSQTPTEAAYEKLKTQPDVIPTQRKVAAESLIASGRGALSSTGNAVNEYVKFFNKNIGGGYDVFGQPFQEEYTKNKAAYKEYEQATQKRLVERLGEKAAQSRLSKSIQGVGQGVVQLGTMAASGPLGFGYLAAQIIDQGTKAYDQAYDGALAQGKSEKEAKNIARVNGWVTGTVNSLESIPVMRTLGIGKDLLLKPIKKSLIATAGRMLKTGVIESGTEAAQEFAQRFTETLTYKQGEAIPWKDAIEAFLVSIPAALLFGSVGEITVRKRAKIVEEMKKEIERQGVLSGATKEQAVEVADAVVDNYVALGDQDLFEETKPKLDPVLQQEIKQNLQELSPDEVYQALKDELQMSHEEATQALETYRKTEAREKKRNPEKVITQVIEKNTVTEEPLSLDDEANNYENVDEFIDASPIYYHGTGDVFTDFNLEKTGGTGFYFTKNKAEAESFAEGKRTGTTTIKEVYLDIKNPAPESAVKEAFNQATGGNPVKMAHDILKQQGYDGIIRKNETVVFSPDQIKTKAQLKEIYNKTKTQKLTVSNEAYKSTVENGGVTINLEGDKPTEGIAYAPFKGTEEIIPKGQPKLKPVKGGERVESKHATDLEARAIQKKLIDDPIAELSDHEQAVMKDQRKAAEDLWKNDKETAVKIALGEENAPEGILATVIYRKVVQEADKSGDVDLITRLATSDFNDEITAQAQALRGLREFRDENSPTEVIKEIIKVKKARLEKKILKGSTVTKVKKNMRAKADKVTAKKVRIPTMKRVEDFINSIEC